MFIIDSFNTLNILTQYIPKTVFFHQNSKTRKFCCKFIIL